MGTWLLKGGEKKIAIQTYAKKLVYWIYHDSCPMFLLRIFWTSNRRKLTNVQMIQTVYWEMMSPSCHTMRSKKLKLPHWSNRFQSTQNLDSKSKIKKWTIFGDFWRCISGYFKKNNRDYRLFFYSSFGWSPLWLQWKFLQRTLSSSNKPPHYRKDPKFLNSPLLCLTQCR